MVTAIISIVAALFFALYVSKSQDCKALERDNKWLKEQWERVPDSGQERSDRPEPSGQIILEPIDVDSVNAMAKEILNQ